MEHYVGLDVSLRLTSICIVDRTGKIQREGVVHSDPEAIAVPVPDAIQSRITAPGASPPPGSERAL